MVEYSVSTKGYGICGINSTATRQRCLPSQKIHRTVHVVFSPHNRWTILEDDHYASLLLSIFVQVACRHHILLHELVVMPDHVHVLMSFLRGRNLQTDVIKKLKGASAREFLRQIQEKDVRHLWNRHFHYEEIDSEKQFRSTIHYIQQNPQKESIDPGGRLFSLTNPGSCGIYSADTKGNQNADTRGNFCTKQDSIYNMAGEDARFIPGYFFFLYS